MSSYPELIPAHLNEMAARVGQLVLDSQARNVHPPDVTNTTPNPREERRASLQPPPLLFRGQDAENVVTWIF